MKVRYLTFLTNRVLSASLVYETSLYLAIIFESPRQTTTILSHLIPDLYLKSPTPSCHITTLISLVHHLLIAYPSQRTFHQHFSSLPASLLPVGSASDKWIRSLSLSLRSNNYFKFEELTRPSVYLALCDTSLTEKSDSKNLGNALKQTIYSNTPSVFSTEALHMLVDELRSKHREKTWHIIRSAYRELACNPDSLTRGWLERSLALPIIDPDNKGADLDNWLEKRRDDGHLRRKDGAAEGRWIVCKIP